MTKTAHERPEGRVHEQIEADLGKLFARSEPARADSVAPERPATPEPRDPSPSLCREIEAEFQRGATNLAGIAALVTRAGMPEAAVREELRWYLIEQASREQQFVTGLLARARGEEPEEPAQSPIPIRRTAEVYTLPPPTRRETNSHHFRLPGDIAEHLDELAEAYGCTRTHIVCAAIESEWKRYQQTASKGSKR